MPHKVLDEPRSTVPVDAAVLLDCLFDRTTLAAMRGELHRCGARSGLSDVALTHVVMAVNEIATNAIRYAGGRGRLSLSRHRNALWCVITDQGPGIPPRCLAPASRRRADQIGGQGIWLAQQICASLDIDTGRSGTRMVLRFALRATPDAT